MMICCTTSFTLGYLHEAFKCMQMPYTTNGTALVSFWVFIDGTVRPICQPQENQRVLYNGHKRVHALKFQSIGTPNDLIAKILGPVEGRRHDSGMLAMLGLLPQLQHMSFSPTGQAMCIYGGPDYLHRIHLQCPFAHRQKLTPAQEAFSQSMSQVRVSVEWVFGDVANYVNSLMFALLFNTLTCLYGNNTSTFSGVKPPTLEEYFG